MTEPNDFDSYLDEVMQEIDEHLAGRDVSLRDRPLHGAITFVMYFVEKIHAPETGEVSPGEPTDFIFAKWFAGIYSNVSSWYRRRYPNIAAEDHELSILGATKIASTIFLLRVPSVRRFPGEEVDTFKLKFPDHILDDEAPLKWLQNGPDLKSLPATTVIEAEALANEIASRLRSVRVSVVGIPAIDKIAGLKSGILSRLQRAAELLKVTNLQESNQAYWEIQIACELALKVAQAHRTGSFQETHDLYRLYDAINPQFERSLLKRLPKWEEMTDFRYGIGEIKSRQHCFECYRVALEIVDASLRSIRHLDIGKGTLTMRKPPWLSLQIET